MADRKLAIIGASYLQMPLIEAAKDMGFQTHVFAWRAGAPGETAADVFYPISITEKEEILDVCRTIGICGICSIGSDLAMGAVSYVADALGLPANSVEAAERAMNKHAMRRAFEKGGDPSARSRLVSNISDLDLKSLTYPVIVKPLDRSGSRGITKLMSEEGLEEAIEYAKEQGFEKKALVEDYIEGKEYSAECISYNGEHHLLAITEKFTTGAPHFIETGHLEPSDLSESMYRRVEAVVKHALDSLGLTTGASHSEFRIDDAGNIRIIEIGGRMGGDFIGSDLVKLTTGVDFVKAVISCALKEEPDLKQGTHYGAAGIRFILNNMDVIAFERLKKEHPEFLVRYEINALNGSVTDSSSRHGYFLMKAETREALLPYMPEAEKKA
ncbi:MAG: ATP-grasp domain-containing protein [Solobacterium sp.]|nr:ATP-grasp domain-containing protein [Solobacterium sp.]